MANYVTITSDKSKTVAFLLCLFLGIFPCAHYFYVGRRPGIIRVITLNFLFIGWLLDLIHILTGSFKDNVGAPLRH